MEAWLKDGTLPDGSKGVTRAVKIETESGEVLSARDRTEVHLIEDIAYHQKRIERWKPDLDVRTEEEFLAEHSPEQLAKRLGDIDYKTHLLEVHARMIAWIPEVAGRIEVSQKTIRGFTSQLWTHRWKRAVEDTQAIHDESAAFLAELRGLSVDVFSWLIQGGYVVLYLGEKATKDGSRKWNDTEIAFPVVQSVNETVWPDTARYWPGFRLDIEFLGMHCKWMKNKVEGGWRYEPKGIPSAPLIIGDVATADRIIVAESTWDPIAYLDEYRLYKEDGWAVVSTRGARNAKLFPAELIKPEAVILALAQNDAANAQWLKELTERVPGREVTVIRPPDECKDYNDYVTALYRERNKI
ncbi:MAG TPA: hypothetical protein VN957_08835 [Chthoniobacterales bacterium]|nr:hypothetical protein [Chthoniobacterales bacterium]